MDTAITEQIRIVESEVRILQRALNVAKDNLVSAEHRLQRLLQNASVHEGSTDPRKQLNG